MELFNKLKNIIESIEEDATKFYDRKNKAAGTRLRKAMQEIKKVAQEVRKDVSEKKKEMKK